MLVFGWTFMPVAPAAQLQRFPVQWFSWSSDLLWLHSSLTILPYQTSPFSMTCHIKIEKAIYLVQPIYIYSLQRVV